MLEERAKERLPVIVIFLLFMECLSSWLDYIEAFLQRKGKYTYFKNNPEQQTAVFISWSIRMTTSLTIS